MSISAPVQLELEALVERLSAIEQQLSQPVGPVLGSLISAQTLAYRLDHRGRDGQVTTRVLESWRTRGLGPAYVRVGRIPYYRPEVVDEWLLSNEFHSTAEEV